MEHITHPAIERLPRTKKEKKRRRRRRAPQAGGPKVADQALYSGASMISCMFLRLMLTFPQSKSGRARAAFTISAYG